MNININGILVTDKNGLLVASKLDETYLKKNQRFIFQLRSRCET